MTHPSLKHPGRWIWLVLLIPVGLGLARLHFSVEIFDLLPKKLPVVGGLKLYQEHFANARELIITINAPEAEQSEKLARGIAEALRQHNELVSTVTWEPPWLEHPEQAAELMAYLWFNQPPEVFAQLTNRLAPAKLPELLAATKEELTLSLSPQEIARLSYDPFGLTRLPESAAGAAPAFGQGGEIFSSRDGKFRILFVNANRNLVSYRQCQQWLDAVRPIVQAQLNTAIPQPATASVDYTGRPAFVAETALGMQHDIVVSVGSTAGIIAILFWLAHKRVKPMLWLLTLLAAILGCTLALGGLIFGSINVVSMGFAAILLGLAVDYAVVHYQEALAHPNLSIPQIRHAIAPSIFWAAVTTISAFLVLNLGGLPGLGQLGTLVGLGVALAAGIMVFEYLPPLFPGRNEPYSSPDRETLVTTPLPPQRGHVRVVFAATAALIIFAAAVLVIRSPPPVDATANALRPRRSRAYAALDQIQTHLNQKREPLWLVLSGDTIQQVTDSLRALQSVLTTAVSNHLIAGFTLPTPLWPHPVFQAENRATAHKLSSEMPSLRQAAQAAGFTETSLALTERMLQSWATASQTPGVYWPANRLSQWIFEKVTTRTPTNYLALGLLNPASTNMAAVNAQMAALESELPRRGVWLSGWELLGTAVFNRVHANMWKVIAPMIFLVLASLWFAFRRPPEIILSLAALLLSGLCVLTIMRLAGWSWNLLDLMAIPLVLGTGVDYSIFMQLALRRFKGDWKMAYHSVGRALLLCGATAVAAFGSLAWSSNVGMASLGQVCAVGIASNMLIAIFLLPVWWHTLIDRGKTG